MLGVISEENTFHLFFTALLGSHGREKLTGTGTFMVFSFNELVVNVEQIIDNM